MIYYNEIDPFAAQWLRNLAANGLIPEGFVDERSIAAVEPSDITGYESCHFFAGIGGWPYALSLAGWVGPVWTGSCPCQPLSSAGQRKGHADERHLWPAFFRLVAECRPATIFGEQVASKDGREWLAGIRADLEHLGYAVGAADLPAACVSAPHIRQRLFWVAHAIRSRIWGRSGDDSKTPTEVSGEIRQQRVWSDPQPSGTRQQPQDGGIGGGMADAQYAIGRSIKRSEQDVVNGHDVRWSQAYGELGARREVFWSGAVWLSCLDGKARRIEPGTFPLADGVPARMGRLRGYGNAIVSQVAAEFIAAFMEL